MHSLVGVSGKQSVYFPFNENIQATTERISDLHRDIGWDEFVRKYHVPSPKVFTRRDGRQSTVLDIRPQEGEDREPIVHYGMATDVIDPNTAMHVMPLALALPHKRIIAFSSPSGIFERHDKLKFKDSRRVATGDLGPLVAPSLEYLRSEHIHKVIAIGYSAGANSVWEAALQAGSYDIEIKKAVSAEPAAIIQRGVFKLGAAYLAGGKELKTYLKACDSKAYREARRVSGIWKYPLRLATVGNMALTVALSKDLYEEQARAALVNDPELTARIIWGTESKMAVSGVMHQITENLQEEFGDRVQASVLNGHTHAMCDDIDLYNAIMLQSLS